MDTGNTTEQGIINSNETFASSLDLFVVPESVGGYGVYEERESSSFAPGEDIVLYSEPVGFSHKPRPELSFPLYVFNWWSSYLPFT